ncbi:MAG TPA: DUF3052 domain-containing protein [Gemmatimonadales bacterium]|nr:DUF3052 domain-containing protein [Gemmatimonadales bacterium]
MAGYSGTPLVQKLGIKPGMRIGIRRAPARFAELLVPWPARAEVTTPATGPLDLLMVFVERAADLERDFPRGAESLTPAGMLWVAWPKRASGVPTDLTEDRVRTIGLAAGLVDVKVCAVTEVWSGLKFVRRLADRPKAAGGAEG